MRKDTTKSKKKISKIIVLYQKKAEFIKYLRIIKGAREISKKTHKNTTKES